MERIPGNNVRGAKEESGLEEQRARGKGNNEMLKLYPETAEVPSAQYLWNSLFWHASAAPSIRKETQPAQAGDQLLFPARSTCGRPLQSNQGHLTLYLGSIDPKVSDPRRHLWVEVGFSPERSGSTRKREGRGVDGAVWKGRDEQPPAPASFPLTANTGEKPAQTQADSQVHALCSVPRALMLLECLCPSNFPNPTP